MWGAAVQRAQLILSAGGGVRGLAHTGKYAAVCWWSQVRETLSRVPCIRESPANVLARLSQCLWIMSGKDKLQMLELQKASPPLSTWSYQAV